jgi:transposase
MHAVRRPRPIGWPAKLAADKGYSYESVRSFLEACGIEPVIPRKSNQPAPKGERFDKKTYRKRARVEQAVGWMKEYRRLGTRYEKLGLNFLAFAKLGVMLRYLRILDPSDKA